MPLSGAAAGTGQQHPPTPLATVRTGQADVVCATAYRPDRQLLVSAGQDRVAR
jgi:hypothetical protein